MWNFELGHSPRRKQLRDCEKDNGAFFTESSIIFYILIIYILIIPIFYILIILILRSNQIAAIRARYLPRISNSRFTRVPFSMRQKFVWSWV